MTSVEHPQERRVWDDTVTLTATLEFKLSGVPHKVGTDEVWWWHVETPFGMSAEGHALGLRKARREARKALRRITALQVTS